MNSLAATASSATAIAQTGMQAAQTRMDVAAHNIANLPTEGFKAAIVTQQTQPGGGVRATVSRRADAGEGYVADRVESLKAMYDFKANLKTLQTADEMLGSLLDIRG